MNGRLRTLTLFLVLTLLMMAAGWVASSYGLVSGDPVTATLIFAVLAGGLNFAMYSMFRTHPQTQERIARLEQMASRTLG